MSAWLCKGCLGDGEVWHAPSNDSACGRCGLVGVAPQPAAVQRLERRKPENNREELWSADVAALQLSVSESWVRQASLEGLLPNVHIGRRLLFRPEVIRAMLDRPEGLPSVGKSRKRSA